MLRKVLHLVVASAFFVVVSSAKDARAVTAVWQGGTSADYFNSANWAGGVAPTTGDAVRVGDTGALIANFPVYTGDNSATPIGSNAPVTFEIGGGQASTFTVQSGSTLVSNGPVMVGTGAFTSTWTQNGGAVTINGTAENTTQGLRLGTVSGATGQLAMNGGTITITGARLTTAQNNGAKANITMSGGEIRATAIHLGSDGVSNSQDAVTTLTLTGGTIKSDKELNFGSSNSNSATHYAGYLNATINNGGTLWATTVGTNTNQNSTVRFQGGHINLGVGGKIKGGDMSGRDGFNYGNIYAYASAGLPQPGLDFRGGVLEFYGNNFALEGNANMGASCAVTAASNNTACYFAVPPGSLPTDPVSYKTFNNRDSLRMLLAMEQKPGNTPFRFYTSLGGTLDGSGNPIPDNNAGDYFVKVVDASGTGDSGSGAATPARAYATIKGDYDGNGVVDAGDYVVWRKYNGYTYLYEATNSASVIPYFGADGNGDGIVDQLDYDVWRANFGKTATGGPFAFGAGSGNGLGSAAVPEPTSALLVLMGAMMASVSCGRRRSNA
jgi:hypothetical protein